MLLSPVSTCWQRPQKTPVQQNQESSKYFWRPLKKSCHFQSS